MIPSPLRPLAVTVLGLAVASLPAAAADDKPILSLQAFAVDIAGTTTRRAETLDIVISRWSTAEEVSRLRAAMVEKGEDGLLDALKDLKPVGRIRTPGNIGWDLHFAHQVPGPDGSRRIRIATDRPMSFWEVINRPRSADYQFLLAEIRLRGDGKGEGKLVPAAKVDYDDRDKTLYIEEWGTEPVRLTEVRVVK